MREKETERGKQTDGQTDRQRGREREWKKERCVALFDCFGFSVTFSLSAGCSPSP